MKRILTIALLILLASSISLMSAAKEDSLPAAAETDSGKSSLADWLGFQDPREKAKLEAQRASVGLEPDRLQALYKDMKVNTGLSSFLSVAVGFGFGQVVIGDMTGASWVSIFDKTGISIAGSGLLLWGGFYLFYYTGSSMGSGTPMSFWDYGMEGAFGKIWSITCFSGLGICVVGRIAGLIRSITWGNSYNRSVREGLGLDKNLELAVLPCVTKDNKPGLMMTGRVSF